jgi:hypothetical protein
MYVLMEMTYAIPLMHAELYLFLLDLHAVGYANTMMKLEHLYTHF